MALFVELEANSARRAGFHTGTNQYVDSDYLNSPAVFQHEAIHDEIFAETPDGILQVLLTRKAKLAGDHEEARALEVASARLLAETRLAHEAGATYLGVLALATDTERSETLSLLDATYRAYFDTYEQVLASGFSSILARFAVASAINRWVFCSPRIQQATSTSALQLTEFWEVPGPTERMARIMAAIKALGPHGLRRRFWQEAAKVPSATEIFSFGFSDDKEWSSVPLPLQRKFDTVATIAATAMVATLLPLQTLREFRVPDYLSGTGHVVSPRWYASDDLEGVSRPVALHVAQRAARRRIHRSLETFPRGDEGWVSERLSGRKREQPQSTVIVARQREGALEYLTFDFQGAIEGGATAVAVIEPFHLRSLLEGLRSAGSPVSVGLVYVMEDWRAPEWASTSPFPDDVLVPMHPQSIESLLVGRTVPGVSCTIISYARAEWADILNKRSGTIYMFDVYLGPMGDVHTPSLVALVYGDVGSGMEASMCLMTKIDFRSIRPLLDFAVAEGRIYIEELTPGDGFHHLFEAVWRSLDAL